MLKMKCETWQNVSGLSRLIEDLAIKRLEQCALEVEREAKKLLRKGGKMSGLNRKMPGVYYNSALRRYVRASQPGQPPHAQTRALLSSIRHK